MKAVGLDLSLTGAGVATITTHLDYTQRKVQVGPASATVQQYGTGPTPSAVAARALRLRGLAAPIIRDCLGADLVLVEDMFIPTKTTAGAVVDRCGLWWLVLASLTSRGIPCAAVTNNALKQYVLGKGGGKDTTKDHVLTAVVRRYPTVNVQTNNQADALVLAAMAARHLGCPLEPDLPQLNLKAMAAVAWPPLPEGVTPHGR